MLIVMSHKHKLVTTITALQLGEYNILHHWPIMFQEIWVNSKPIPILRKEYKDFLSDARIVKYQHQVQTLHYIVLLVSKKIENAHKDYRVYLCKRL